MFWDTVLLRFHFGFGDLPTGLDYLGRALSSAYTPRQRMFAVFPSGPTHLPQLSAFSVWLLAKDCPRTILLGQRTHQYLHDLTSRLSPLKVDISTFPTQLAANTPVDAVRWLAEARQGLVSEAAALAAIEPGYRQRMGDFRARVQMQAPVALGPAILSDFATLWERYQGSHHLRPEDFLFDWVLLDVEGSLIRWPANPAYFSWNTRPTWIDQSEWAFLRCCYNAGVSPIDRLALFLLIYGALTVSQITRLFRGLHPQTGWTYPLNAQGYTAVMHHLVEQWVAVLRCMARAGVAQKLIGGH